VTRRPVATAAGLAAACVARAVPAASMDERLRLGLVRPDVLAMLAAGADVGVEDEPIAGSDVDGLVRRGARRDEVVRLVQAAGAGHTAYRWTVAHRHTGVLGLGYDV
jgi:hypothetical protein